MNAINFIFGIDFKKIMTCKNKTLYFLDGDKRIFINCLLKVLFKLFHLICLKPNNNLISFYFLFFGLLRFQLRPDESEIRIKNAGVLHTSLLYLPVTVI